MWSLCFWVWLVGGVQVVQLLYYGIPGDHDVGVPHLQLVLSLRLAMDLLLQMLKVSK